MSVHLILACAYCFAPSLGYPSFFLPFSHLFITFFLSLLSFLKSKFKWYSAGTQVIPVKYHNFFLKKNLKKLLQWFFFLLLLLLLLWFFSVSVLRVSALFDGMKWQYDNAGYSVHIIAFYFQEWKTSIEHEMLYNNKYSR